FKIKQRTVDVIILLIKKEREEEKLDPPHPLIQSLLDMFHDIHIYNTAFEIPFIQSTESFYHEEGERLSSSLSIPQYMRHISSRLKEETLRYEGYFDDSTRNSVITVVEEE